MTAIESVRLEQLRRSGVEDRLSFIVGSGRANSALPEIERLVAAEPLQEGPVDLLMRALVSGGRKPEALRAFDTASVDWVTIGGSGTVVIEGLDNETFYSEISGSGDLVAIVTSDHLMVLFSGSGEFDGRDLVASSGRVDISGSGEALANVTDELEAEISGSCEAEYIVDPTLNSRTSGSGDISKR
jgi:hypothetical protein